MGTELGNLQRSGGARRERTADLLHAMQALSQLSYGPTGWKGAHSEGGFGKRQAADRSDVSASARKVATPCPCSARYCSHLPRKVFIRSRWSRMRAGGGYMPITSCQRRPA